MKITVKNFQNRIPVNPKRIKQTIQKVLSKEKSKKSGEITVTFVNDKKIKELNLKYKGNDEPTDVLAFDIAERPGQVLADIIISTDTAASNAKIFKTSAFYELYLYVAHGTLHLLGYGDRTKKQMRVMHKKERQYVNPQD